MLDLAAYFLCQYVILEHNLCLVSHSESEKFGMDVQHHSDFSKYRIVFYPHYPQDEGEDGPFYLSLSINTLMRSCFITHCRVILQIILGTGQILYIVVIGIITGEHLWSDNNIANFSQIKASEG